MKKVVSTVLAVCLCFVCFANGFAEEFTLHSGVKFGMTMDEVLQQENNAEFTDAKIVDFKEYDIYNCPEDHSPQGVRVEGQIAGVSGAYIDYHFTKTGEMDAAIYVLVFSLSQRGNYSPIRESLISKYGEPDTDMSKVWHSLLNMDVYSYLDAYKNDIDITEVNYYYNDSWLIEQDDGNYILITGYDAKMQISIENYRQAAYLIYVGYQQFTKEEIESALAIVNEAVDTYNSQLENDL